MTEDPIFPNSGMPVEGSSSLKLGTTDSTLERSPMEKQATLNLLKEIYNLETKDGTITEASIFVDEKIVELEDQIYKVERYDERPISDIHTTIQNGQNRLVTNNGIINLNAEEVAQGLENIKFIGNTGRIEYIRGDGRRRIFYLNLDQVSEFAQKVNPKNLSSIEDRISVQQASLESVTIGNLTIINNNLVAPITPPGEQPPWGISLSSFKNPMNREFQKENGGLFVYLYLKNGESKSKVRLTLEEYKKIIDSI